MGGSELGGYAIRMPDRLTPEQWLAKAAEARVIAATMTDAGNRATLLRIADGYEKIAHASALLQTQSEKKTVER
jgi:hypothetical protein